MRLADEIAVRQLHALKQYCTRKLRLSGVREMFAQTKGNA